MKTTVAIVGGGASALMLASTLDSEKFEISLYEKNIAPGRKFLVAGDGGLNLTHSENQTGFIKRYTPAGFLERAFSHFSNADFIHWLHALGVETFIGSSGRVFPKKGIKPIEVLNRMLDQIKRNGVSLHTKYVLKDFSLENGLVFEHKGWKKEVNPKLVIFCMGGASWPVTGSTGDWSDLFKDKAIRINPFRASNCSFNISWTPDLVPKIEGKALKNISIRCGTAFHLGEAVITRSGLEGSGIYPLSPEIRKLLDAQERAEIHIDFKPALSLEKIKERLVAKPAELNTTDFLKTELHLTAVQVQLLKHFLSKEEYLDPDRLSQKIKEFSLYITGTGPIEDAISTVGGIDLDELDSTFQLKKLPHHYAIGEMLDYDAPTGGYLLQSCYSMANYLARHLNLTHF